MNSHSRQQSIPSTSAKIKQHRLDKLVEFLVLYSELSGSARHFLTTQQSLTQAIDFKIFIEINFCTNLLQNIIKVDPISLQAIRESILKNPQFGAEVEKFASQIVPKKSVIITPNQFREEVTMIKRQRC